MFTIAYIATAGMRCNIYSPCVVVVDVDVVDVDVVGVVVVVIVVAGVVVLLLLLSC